MKKTFLFQVCILTMLTSTAQTASFDIINYAKPAGWKEEQTTSSIVYSKINNKARTWCQLAIYKTTASKGNVQDDFNSEWASIVTPLGVAAAAQLSGVQDANGWQVLTGTGSFTFNNATATTHLKVYSGYNRCFSILVNSTTNEFDQNLTDFYSSLSINQEAVAQLQSSDSNSTQEESNTNTPTNATNAPTPGIATDYAFNTTNFDDGWTSTVQEDWVEVTRGDIKVLLHYPKEGTIFPADPEPLIKAAWNILVAPRYSNLKNFKTIYISTYNRPYLGMGNLTENTTQKEVYIVFFRQSAGWIEVISPDKNSFIRQFKFDPETIRWDSDPDILKTLDNMTGRNKFAVAASDLDGTGKWSESFSSNTYYTNIYTGVSAGMSTYTSSQWFEFGTGKSYKWQLVAANTYGGATNLAQAKGVGTFKSINNWQLYFTDIEGKPKTYDVYFTALKGKRTLWMNDAEHPGSGIFSGYSKK